MDVHAASHPAPQIAYHTYDAVRLGADQNYDVEAFVEHLNARKIEPHVAINGTVS